MTRWSNLLDTLADKEVMDVNVNEGILYCASRETPDGNDLLSCQEASP